MRIPRCVLGTLVALLLPANAAAQSLRGAVLHEGSLEPVSLALVLLLDADDRVIASRLTNDQGRFTIRVQGEEAPVRIRAERIGLGVVTLDLNDHDESERLQLLMPVAAIPIEGIAVEAVDQCPADPRDEDLAQAWARFRPLLESLQYIDPDRPRRFEVEYSETKLSSTGDEVARMLTDTVFTSKAVPFETAEPAVLMSDGFVVEESETRVMYYAPDARVLLSPEFIASHCYRLPETQERQGYLEIEYAPRSQEGEGDIQGVLALPLDQGRLPVIEYTFTSHPWRYRPDPRLGGFVELAPTDVGWVVSQWELRVPGPPVVGRDRVPPVASMTAYRGRLLRVLTSRDPSDPLRR